MKKYLVLFILISSAIGCNGSQRTLAIPNNQESGSHPATGNNQVKLTWNSNLGEQQGFYLEQSTDGVNFTQILQLPDGTNTATVTVANGSANSYFRVRGFNQAGTSPYSSVVTVQ